MSQVQTYATVLADSVGPKGQRLITWEVCCHRWILAEINTHRAFSRNYRSSRAVPTKRMIEEVRNNPAMPIAWLSNKAGMTGGTPLSPAKANHAKLSWLAGAKEAAEIAESLLGCELHKQWVNRVLEPYLYVYGVISATDTANFFHLRRAADAQPEFKLLADCMFEAMEQSTPQFRDCWSVSEPASTWTQSWHLPYVSNDERKNRSLTQLIFLSAARCARVSIRPFDGSSDIQAELDRAQRLLTARHMSPFEHQARADTFRNANFNGWLQYRTMLPSENVETLPYGG